VIAARDLTETQWCLPPRPNKRPSSGSSTFVSRPVSPPTEVVGEPVTTTSSNNSSTFLPNHHQILELVEAFFSLTATIFPYIRKATVLQHLDSMRASCFKDLHRSHLCMLNMVMALACVFGNFDSPIGEKIRRGNEFLHRALALLPNWMANTANLETRKRYVDKIDFSAY
jgi:hypothetical protein